VVTRSIFYGLFSLLTGDDVIMDQIKFAVTELVEKLLVNNNVLQAEWSQDYVEMLFDVLLWATGLIISVGLLWVVTQISYCVHRSCGWRRTRFPTSMSQWGRLLIVVNNLTYFLWFWTAFFWITYNFYGVFVEQVHSFDPVQMTALAWGVQLLNWSMVLFSCLRYRLEKAWFPTKSSP